MRQAQEALGKKTTPAPAAKAPKRTKSAPRPKAVPVAEPAREEVPVAVEKPAKRRGWGRKAKKTQSS